MPFIGHLLRLSHCVDTLPVLTLTLMVCTGPLLCIQWGAASFLMSSKYSLIRTIVTVEPLLCRVDTEAINWLLLFLKMKKEPGFHIIKCISCRCNHLWLGRRVCSWLGCGFVQHEEAYKGSHRKPEFSNCCGTGNSAISQYPLSWPDCLR